MRSSGLLGAWDPPSAGPVKLGTDGFMQGLGFTEQVNRGCGHVQNYLTTLYDLGLDGIPVLTLTEG